MNHQAETDRQVDAQRLHEWLRDGAEIALLDVRGQGAFAERNLFLAASIPLGEIEILAARTLPRRATRIVVVSEAADGLSDRAANRLRDLGYGNVHVLAGGIAAWERAGYPLYSGVHVPSKAFAEVVEEHYHTPWIGAKDLQALRDAGERVAIFDSRSFPEYQRYTVPGSVSLPGAELVRHIRDQVPDEDTLVVVNCGGRTRSIIGAQALIAAGLPNRVVSLKDGTMAQRLEGLALEEGATRRPVHPSDAARQWGTAAAARVAERHEVKVIGHDDLAALRAEEARTLYLFDVRTPEEYAAGHLPGSVSAQGGQLVQETDTFAPVWGARIVLVDDENLIRARITAFWLQQLGWRDVAVLALADAVQEIGPQPLHVLGLGSLPSFPDETIDADGLADLQSRDAATIIDLSRSTQYRAGHIPGAWFVTRARLAERLAHLPATGTLVLTSDDGVLARFAAADLRASGVASVVLAGGNAAWKASGRKLETGPGHIGDTIDDVWLPPAQREGDVEAAMRTYLTWEIGLAEQVRHDPLVPFRLGATHQPGQEAAA